MALRFSGSAGKYNSGSKSFGFCFFCRIVGIRSDSRQLCSSQYMSHSPPSMWRSAPTGFPVFRMEDTLLPLPSFAARAPEHFQRRCSPQRRSRVGATFEVSGERCLLAEWDREGAANLSDVCETASPLKTLLAQVELRQGSGTGSRADLGRLLLRYPCVREAGHGIYRSSAEVC